jgi:hypothetical protein
MDRVRPVSAGLDIVEFSLNVNGKSLFDAFSYQRSVD